MARGRVRTKGSGILAISSLSIVCGSALICLALVSVICVRPLDLGDFHPGLRLPPFPFPDHGVTKVGSSVWLDKEPNDLRDVPGRGDSTLENVWNAKDAERFYGCSAPSTLYKPPSSSDVNGYLMIEASGGLNQQRTGITDSVVVARILNATLVVPKLDHASFWLDKSNFSDIFDVEHFISSVAPDVRVIKELPLDVKENITPFRTHVPRKSRPQFYKQKILPKLIRKQVLTLSKFDFRLSNRLDEDFQKLRCRVNYHALQFTEPIAQMGKVLVERMRRKGGRYIALHLRFEPDMLAFSGCYYGGGPREIIELGEIRKRWRHLPALNPEKSRRNGKCPLSPIEMGLLLRASGFGEDTNLYVASGEVYGGEATLAPLKKLFPKFYTKESLSTEDEFRPFLDFSSRMAAIDYIVCDDSNVFAANNNGNMARILSGHRRFSGHRRTIRPNAKRLSPIFLARHQLGWEEFAHRVRYVQKGFVGDPNEGRHGRGEFHENPGNCICKRDDNQSLTIHSVEQNQSSKEEGEFQASEAIRETRWPEFEDDFDVDDEPGVNSEGYVRRTRIMGDEALQNTKMQGRIQEEDSEEVQLLSEWDDIVEEEVASEEN